MNNNKKKRLRNFPQSLFDVINSFRQNEIPISELKNIQQELQKSGVRLFGFCHGIEKDNWPKEDGQIEYSSKLGLGTKFWVIPFTVYRKNNNIISTFFIK